MADTPRSDITRRGLIGATATLAGASLVTTALAADQQPRALFGDVKGGKVTLPPLHGKTEVNGAIPNPSPEPKRLGIAVVGLGHLSLEQILPGFGQAGKVKATALVSGERDKARAIAAQHGVPELNLYSYDTFDKIRDNDAIDIVYIVLPNSMHEEFTVRALQAGKHVLCEKPMATSSAEAQRMVDAAKAANRKLMIAYRSQYQEAHRQLIDWTRARTYGDVTMIQAANGQNDAANGQWRQIKALAGGGSLPDVGLYCLNAFRYLTGEEPVEVMGQITQPKGDPRFREIEDVATFSLRFPSGILAQGTSNYSGHENRFLRVMAAEAWYGLDPAFGYDNLTVQIGRKAGKANAMETRHFANKNQFAVEMDHFAEAIAANRQPHTPGEEGVQDHKIMEAIYQSAAGGSVVKLPEVKGLDTTRGPAPEPEEG